jgi:mRNA-degrading endonuclease toxin of MazEF toxin-antitoxin module
MNKNIAPGDVVTAMIAFPGGATNTQAGQGIETIPAKKRPVIVISSLDFNSRESHYVVVPITSNSKKSFTNDVLIQQEEQTRCKLRKTSVARAGRLTTIGRELLRTRLGEAPDSLMDKIYSQIRTILGL